MEECSKENSASRYDPNECCLGDVIFFSGEDVISESIKATTASKWSHVGMLLDLSNDTIKTIREFVYALPGNWKDISARLLREVLLSSSSARFEFKNALDEELDGRVFNEAEMMTLKNEAGKGIIDSELSRLQHITEFFIIWLLIKNHKPLTKAIAKESSYHTKKISKFMTRTASGGNGFEITKTFGEFTSNSVGFNSSSSTSVGHESSDRLDSSRVLQSESGEAINVNSGEKRVICLWESTTSSGTFAKCLITDKDSGGVKLTNLEQRYIEYGRVPVGIRHLYLDSFEASSRGTASGSGEMTQSSSTKKKRTGAQSNKFMRIPCFLRTMITNIVLNVGKDYETQPTEMIDAWIYDNFAPVGAVLNPFAECMSFLFPCFCSGKSVNPYDNVLGEYYNPLLQYEALYCSELVMQCLLDCSFAEQFNLLVFSDFDYAVDAVPDTILVMDSVGGGSLVWFKHIVDVNLVDVQSANGSIKDTLRASQSVKHIFGSRIIFNMSVKKLVNRISTSTSPRMSFTGLTEITYASDETAFFRTEVTPKFLASHDTLPIDYQFWGLAEYDGGLVIQT